MNKARITQEEYNNLCVPVFDEFTGRAPRITLDVYKATGNDIAALWWGVRWEDAYFAWRYANVYSAADDTHLRGHISRLWGLLFHDVPFPKIADVQAEGDSSQWIADRREARTILRTMIKHILDQIYEVQK